MLRDSKPTLAAWIVRSPLIIFSAALFALMLGGISPAVQESVASATVPPNLVFIIADDLRWARLGTYRSDEISTPSCTPSRASIFYYWQERF